MPAYRRDKNSPLHPRFSVRLQCFSGGSHVEIAQTIPDPKHPHPIDRGSRQHCAITKYDRPTAAGRAALAFPAPDHSSGPEVSVATFSEAEKLVQIEMSPADLTKAAISWRANMAALYERRTGPRSVSLEITQPATHWNPMLPGIPLLPLRDRFVRSADSAEPLPANDQDIAFRSRQPSLPLD